MNWWINVLWYRRHSFDILQICLAAMILPLKIDICTCQPNDIEGLALSQEENYRFALTAANCATCEHISDSCQQNYQVRSTTEVHVGPLQIPPVLSVPGSQLIMPVLSISLEVLRLLTFCIFSENIVHKHVAPLPLLSRKLIIKYLSLTVDPIVAEQIYTTPELCRRYQRIFIYQFNNFCIAEIWSYSAAFVQIWLFFYDIKEKKSGCFLLKHRVVDLKSVWEIYMFCELCYLIWVKNLLIFISCCSSCLNLQLTRNFSV